MEQTQKTTEPITLTRDELEAQGYTNPDQHPALDTNVATRKNIEVSDRSSGSTVITVADKDMSAFARDALSLIRIDGTTGTVLTSGEANNADRGVTTYR